jgi:hypothetical protein
VRIVHADVVAGSSALQVLSPEKGGLMLVSERSRSRADIEAAIESKRQTADALRERIDSLPHSVERERVIDLLMTINHEVNDLYIDLGY